MYKVIGPELQILALKRVNLQNTDPSTVESYINEIELLRRLKDNPMVIRLVDAEIHHHQRVIDIVLEYGEVDLANLLRVSDEGLLDINTIRVFWQQMLRAVKTIHEERIVHGDLKVPCAVLLSFSFQPNYSHTRSLSLSARSLPTL